MDFIEKNPENRKELCPFCPGHEKKIRIRGVSKTIKKNGKSDLLKTNTPSFTHSLFAKVTVFMKC
jgi:hypothetical protein